MHPYSKYHVRTGLRSLLFEVGLFSNDPVLLKLTVLEPIDEDYVTLFQLQVWRFIISFAWGRGEG